MKNTKPVVTMLKFSKLRWAIYLIMTGNTRKKCRKLAEKSYGKGQMEDQIIYGNVTLR
jgi:hypothetical protein